MAVRITDGGLNWTASIDDAPLNASIRSLKEKLREYQRVASQSLDKETLSAYNKKIQETQAEIRKLSNIGKAGFDELGNKINKSKNSISSLNTTIKSLAGGFLAYLSVGSVFSFSKQVLDTTAEFEKLEAVLGNTLGSKGIARSAMSMINDIASKTPFSVAELTDSFVKLANRGFTPTAKEIKKMGDLASSTGKSFNQLTEAVLDAMTGENERLKEFGIKAKKHGDMVTYTFKGVKTEVKNSADAIKDYLLTLGDLKGVKGSMDVISATLTGKISNLGDSWDQMLVSIGSNTKGVFSGIISILDSAIKKITQFNKDSNIRDKFNLEGDFTERLSRTVNPLWDSGATKTEVEVFVIDKAQKEMEGFILKTVEGAKSVSDFGNSINSVFGKFNQQIMNNPQFSKKLKNALAIIANDTMKTLKEARTNFEQTKSAKSKPLADEANKKQEAEYQDLLKKRLTILEQINQLQFNSKKAGKTPLQVELDDNNARIDELKKRVIEFNKLAIASNAKNPKKTKLIDVDSVENERNPSNNIIELKYDLSQKEKEYTRYYETVRAIGETNTKRFFALAKDAQGKDIVDYATYLNTKLALAKTAQEKSIIKKEIETNNEALLKRQIEDIGRAQDAARTSAEVMLMIEADYQKKLKDLGDKATDQQKANLERQRNDAIRSEANKNFMIESEWDDLFASYDRMSKEAALKAFASAKALLEAQKASGQMNLVDYQNFLSQIEDAENKINDPNQLKGVTTAHQRYKQVLKESAADSVKAKEAFADYVNELEQKGKMAVDALRGLQEIVNMIGGGMSDQTNKDISAALDMAEGGMTLAAGIASGDPAKIIQGGIQLVTSAIKLFDRKDINLEKKINGYKKILKSLENSYKTLQRQVDQSVGNSYYNDSEKLIQNLKRQNEQVNQMRQAEADKKKADQGKLDSYDEQITDFPNKIDDINRAVNQTLLQTDYKQLSGTLADALTNAFRAGEDGVRSLDNAFNDFIGKSIQNSLRLAIIEPIVKKVTDDLVAYGKANGNSVKGFDFEPAREQLQEAGKLFTANIEALPEFFKTDKSKAQGGGLAGAIKRDLTEETGTLIAGQFNGMRLAQIEANALLGGIGMTGVKQLEIATMHLETAIKIETNTRRTADTSEMYLPYLKNMSERIGGDLNIQLRAQGK